MGSAITGQFISSLDENYLNSCTYTPILDLNTQSNAWKKFHRGKLSRDDIKCA